MVFTLGPTKEHQVSLDAVAWFNHVPFSVSLHLCNEKCSKFQQYQRTPSSFFGWFDMSPCFAVCNGEANVIYALIVDLNKSLQIICEGNAEASAVSNVS